MKKDDDWLLNLGRTPTLEELQEHFHDNDFSAAAYMDIDFEAMPAETVEQLEHYKSLVDEKWDAIAKEMGLAEPASHYGEDNPLTAMRDNLGYLAASGVMKLIDERPERAQEILARYMSDPNIDRLADNFLYNAVKKTMEVMDYPKLVQVIQEIPAHEDFNQKNSRGNKAKDFFRKWNHSRAKTKVTSLDEMSEETNNEGESVPAQIIDKSVDVEEQTLVAIKGKRFWESLNKADRALLELRMKEMSHQEIADVLGLSRSTVTKRLQKLRARFDQMG